MTYMKTYMCFGIQLVFTDDHKIIQFFLSTLIVFMLIINMFVKLFAVLVVALSASQKHLFEFDAFYVYIIILQGRRDLQRKAS